MICANCFTLCPDGQTTCHDCGRPLPVTAVEPRPAREVPHGCTCGGNDVCTACAIASYDTPSRL